MTKFLKIIKFLLLICGAFLIGYAKVYLAIKYPSNSVGMIEVILTVVTLTLIYIAFKMFWHYKIWVLIPIFIIFAILMNGFPLDKIFLQGYSPFSMPLPISAGIGMVGPITAGISIWVLIIKAILFIARLLRFVFRKLKKGYQSINPKLQEKISPTISKVKDSVKDDW